MSGYVCPDLVVDLSQIKIDFSAKLDEAQRKRIENWLRRALKTVRVDITPQVDNAIVIATYPNAGLVVTKYDADRIIDIIENGWAPEDATVRLTGWGYIEVTLPNGKRIALSTNRKMPSELSKSDHKKYIEVLKMLEKYYEVCKKIDELEEGLAKTKREKEETERELRRRIEELQKQKEMIEAENAALRKRVMELEEKVGRLESRIQELEEELNQCYDEEAAEETNDEEYEDATEYEGDEEDADP